MIFCPMKHYIIYLILFLLTGTAQAKNVNLDSLYNCLDKEIMKSDEYVRDKQARIDPMLRRYLATPDKPSRH